MQKLTWPELAQNNFRFEKKVLPRKFTKPEMAQMGVSQAADSTLFVLIFAF